MMGRTIKELNVGDSASQGKTISESDIYMFAGLTGDFNPAHVNKPYAEGTFFKARIAHGLLLGGFISAVIAMYLPGPGTIYLEQTMSFRKPVYIGDTITARVEIIEIDTGKHRVRLKTACTNQNDVVVLDGEALVSPPVDLTKPSNGS